MSLKSILVLLVILRQATGVCNLCFDGEAITKPDYTLSLTDPIPLETCQDLSDILTLIAEDDTLCSAARAVSTLCGCPNVPPNACTICGANTTRPQQNLDGLVDLGGVDFFGLAPTCELVESGINGLNQDDKDCLALPMDGLKLYCGCPNAENEGGNSNNDACPICPGGEILPDRPEDDFIFLTLNSVPAPTPGDNTISCKEAKVLAKGEESGSVLCGDIRLGSTACGCPVPENACQICPDGSKIIRNSEFVDSIFGVRIICDHFDTQLHRFDRNSTECQSLDENYAETCGCTQEEELVPCTLCPAGESVPYPDKEIVGMEGLGFDYIKPTCGTFEKVVLVLDEKEPTCTSARLLAKVCGCAVPETGCSICQAGDSLSNPFGQYQWAFGTVTTTLPELAETIDFNDRKFRCELADSFLSVVYDNDDDVCYLNQLLRGSACGCSGSNTAKVVALVWTQRCSGFLSLVGSLLIVTFVLTKKSKDRWNTYNQIVLSISIFDTLSSLAYIFGTALTPAALGLYGSIGNEATCNFQGWLLQIGITSVYYNAVLCFYFLFVVKYNWSERKFSKVRKWVHLSVLVVGISMSFAVIPFVTPDWRWCYLNKPPIYDSWLPGVFFFILPIGVCMIAMTVIMVFFVKYVRQMESKSKARKMKGNGPTRQSLASRTFWQSLYFLAVFYTVWPIQFVAFVIPLVEENYWVYLLAALLGPLQGFLNAMIVFYRDRKVLRQRLMRLRGIKHFTEIWSSVFMFKSRTTTTTQSAMSAASGRVSSPLSPFSTPKDEEKHKSPACQVESNEKESEQPENDAIDTLVGIDASLGKYEDLKPGSEGRDNDDESKKPARNSSSIFETSDAILEFAITAGLLDEIDYQIHQESIAALESSQAKVSMQA